MFCFGLRACIRRGLGLGVGFKIVQVKVNQNSHPPPPTPARPYHGGGGRWERQTPDHSPPPPPSPWYPPLPVKWVVVLFGLVAFPVRSCLASSPPPLWGAVCSTEVWYGCCHSLIAMSSLRALSPPPLWGGACGRFGWPRPACAGQCVLHRYGMVGGGVGARDPRAYIPTLRSRPKKCRSRYVAGSGFHSRLRLAVAGTPRNLGAAAALMHSETTHSRVRGQASWLGGPNMLNGLGENCSRSHRA